MDNKNFTGKLILLLSLMSLLWFTGGIFAEEKLVNEKPGAHSIMQDAEKLPKSKSSDKATSATLSDFNKKYMGDLSKWKKTKSGVYYRDMIKGKGKEVKTGDGVHGHLKTYHPDGTLLDDTSKARLWYSFTYDKGEISKEFEEGLASIRQGTKRQIVIPAAYVLGDIDYEYKGKKVPKGSYMTFEFSVQFVAVPEWDKVKMWKK